MKGRKEKWKEGRDRENKSHRVLVTLRSRLDLQQQSRISPERNGPPWMALYRQRFPVIPTKHGKQSKIMHAHFRSCSPCQSSVDYGNTKIAQPNCQSVQIVEGGHYIMEFRAQELCEVAVLGSPSLIVLMVSVDVKQH